MKTRIAALTALVLAGLLTGCSAPTDAPAVAPAPAQNAQEAPQAEPVEKPLQAAPQPAPSDEEASFLFELRKRTDITTVVAANDEQLISAGRAACGALAVEPDLDSLRLIEGETPQAHSGRYFDSVVIGHHAVMFLCPEITLPAPQ